MKCRTCLHYDICRFNSIPVFGMDNVACQYEAHELVGEWKPKQMLIGGNGAVFMHDGYECKCGRVVTQKENFCPDCGARMRKEDD